VGPETCVAFGRAVADGSFADGPVLLAALDSCVAALRLAVAAARAAARRAWRFTPGMAVGDFGVAGSVTGTGVVPRRTCVALSSTEPSWPVAAPPPRGVLPSSDCCPTTGWLSPSR